LPLTSGLNRPQYKTRASVLNKTACASLLGACACSFCRHPPECPQVAFIAGLHHNRCCRCFFCHASHLQDLDPSFLAGPCLCTSCLAQCVGPCPGSSYLAQRLGPCPSSSGSAQCSGQYSNTCTWHSARAHAQKVPARRHMSTAYKAWGSARRTTRSSA